MPYDKIDENLYDDVNKWKNVKVKYIDGRPVKDLKYSKNEEDTSIPLYTIEVATSYNNENVISVENGLSEANDNIVSSLTTNDVDISKWGTRHNIVFNKDFLNNRFKNVNEAMNSIIIPFGNFYEPYVNWIQPDTSVDGYRFSVNAGYTPFITETAHVLPHAVAISGDSKVYFRITEKYIKCIEITYIRTSIYIIKCNKYDYI